ncbi:MAG TPA: RluA family pseudouridine synthase [Bryobacteraceae bacterium]|nr:RluA family pseudouridine synthase [Bryobacteraceae bacterium]
MKFTAELHESGKRLDHVLQARLTGPSRSRIQQWIKAQRVRVNGHTARSSHLVRAGDEIDVEPVEPPPLRAVPEDIPIAVLYSDEDLVAIDKPAGMVVHAGAGRHSGTLVNALLHHFRALSAVGGEDRPGIVHRLDRDTSGVVLVARTDAAHRALARQFAGRAVDKTYLALVQGVLRQEHGHVRSAITRDPVRRTRMTTRAERGRAAHTEYRVLRRFAGHTLLEVRIHTGRTHQIRVHLASIGHPVAGDTLYGAARTPHGRFFLHAKRIAFTSPTTGERVIVEAGLPPELEAWLREIETPNHRL